MDSTSFRQTAAQFVTGVTVIAAENGGAVHAMTANSFTSLSLSPPLVLFCAGKHTKMSAHVREAARFAVNILARGQEDISSYFAGVWKQPEPPPFSFETWAAVPRLAGCAGVLACGYAAIPCVRRFERLTDFNAPALPEDSLLARNGRGRRPAADSDYSDVAYLQRRKDIGRRAGEREQ